MANRFALPAEWENSSIRPSITTHKKFAPTFLDNLTLVVRHGGHATIDNLWCGTNHSIQVTKLFYILKGKGHLIVEGKHYDLESGNFYVIPEHHTHTFYIDCGEQIEKYWFHVNIHMDSADFFSVSNLPVQIKATDHKKATMLCKNLSDCVRKMYSYHNSNEIPMSLILNEKSYLAAIIGYMVECFEAESHKVEQSLGKDFGLIINYIEQNICEDIKIEKLAELINMHPNYFVSKFKKVYSQTPHQLILNKKISKAKELLSFTDLSVSHIASHLGYNDVYYFSTQFKKITKMSPSAYRKSTKGF